MKTYRSIQAFILGGGKSLRLNRDKAFLRYRDSYFIDIVIDCCASIFGSVHLVGKQYEHPQLSGCMDDEIQGVGPLGGILTALGATATELNFFIGVDYPLIDTQVVSLLADAAVEQHEGGRVGLIPTMPDGPHPLFAFYGEACLPAVRQCIDDHSLRVQCIAGHVPILYLDMTKIQGGPDPAVIERNFVNINHVHDLKKIAQE